MNHPTCTLRVLLATLVTTVALPAVTASAEDRFRIPLPPPPGEVIRDVRGFIHGIGRGIKRGAQRALNGSEEREERDLPQPRRDQGPNGEWDGKFYPDEYDRRGPRPPQDGRPLPPPSRELREIPPREIPDGPGGWTSEEQLRREEAARESARNYRPSEMPPGPQASTKKKSTQPGTEGTRTPTPPPQTSATNKDAGVKQNTPPTTTPKTDTNPTAPTTEVQYATPVPGKKGLVYPPGVDKTNENMVDVGDFKAGQLVRNPRNGELFRVP
jgi:hypothetical protein